jgi:hypothetical protein
MPKATMHEYDFTLWSEDYIRPARQVRDVKTVSIAKTMQQFSYQHLGTCIFGVYRSHNDRTLLGADMIGQDASKPGSTAVIDYRKP